MRFAAIAVLAGLLGTPLPAAPNRLRVYPNTSITILSIAQGPDGFLWLAAADGLYRFDGFHYHKIPSFPFSTARKIVSTRNGSLWIGSAEGLVRYNGRFTVVLQDDVSELIAFPEDVIAKLNLHDNAHVHVDGAVQRFRLYARRDLTVDSTGRIWFIATIHRDACWTDLASLGTSYQRTSVPVPGDFLQAAVDGLGRLWVADNSRAIAVRDGQAVAEFHRRPDALAARASALLSGRNGQVWFLGETIQGAAPTRVFRDRQAYGLLDVTAGFEDPRGHLWAAVQGRGLVEWIPDANWDRWFPEDLGNQSASQVLRTAKGGLVAVSKSNLFRLGRDSQEWSPFAKGVGGSIEMFPLPDGGFLASVENLGVVRLSAAGSVVERLANPESTDDYRQIQRDSQGRLWVGHAQALLRVEGQPGSYTLHPSRLPVETPNLANPSDLEIASDGKLWVGYENGIAWLDDAGQWHQLPTDRPLEGVFSFSPPDPNSGDIWMAQLGKDRWAGHDGARFARLTRTGAQWTVHEFTAKDGYGPPDTRFLKRDSRGWIWRGATGGVYVSNGRDVAPNDWLHITAQNGLAAESTHPYGFFEDTDGTVWIAGEQGITHLKPGPAWFDAPHNAPAPRITRVEADGKVFLSPGAIPDAIETRPRLLRIEVGTLDGPPFREYPLRYRLPPSMPEWQLSRDGALEFQNLPANVYRLEVAYTGTGQSPILQFAFRVGPPPSKISWLWAIPAVLAAAVIIARRTPALERLHYRVQKAIFLVRRRMSSGELPESRDSLGRPDHTGETLLGRYRLMQAISRGGFSVVYEARDLVEGTTRVAVKVINVSAQDENWVRDRFAYEVASLRSVNHPGVVPILDSWVSPQGQPCLVMPFLEGPTLRDAMAAGPFRKERVARIVRKLGSVLSEVHLRGIVHRDLKPENVILLRSDTEEEQPVLIDFGMASLRGGENRMWNTTLLGGSFHYMAPERLTEHYSQGSDLYSFGVAILEMLSGSRLPDLNVMISDEAFPDALGQALEHTVDAANLPRLVRNLCSCYAPDPQRRPRDVGAWAEEVAALLDPVRRVR